MAFVSNPWLVTISLSCWGKLCYLPPEHKNSTGNNIQKDVHTFMKQSYHVPIIRIVQQINKEMI